MCLALKTVITVTTLGVLNVSWAFIETIVYAASVPIIVYNVLTNKNAKHVKMDFTLFKMYVNLCHKTLGELHKSKLRIKMEKKLM